MIYLKFVNYLTGALNYHFFFFKYRFHVFFPCAVGKFSDAPFNHKTHSTSVCQRDIWPWLAEMSV